MGSFSIKSCILSFSLSFSPSIPFHPFFLPLSLSCDFDFAAHAIRDSSILNQNFINFSDEFIYYLLFRLLQLLLFTLMSVDSLKL